MRRLSVILFSGLLLVASCRNEEEKGKDTMEEPAISPNQADTTQEQSNVPAPPPASGEGAYKYPDIEGKSWVLSKYTYEGRQERPVGKSAISIQVNGNQLSGNGGCNRLNGQIFLGENGTVDISNISKTREICAGLMIQETRVVELLEGAESFKGNLVFLELSGPGGQLTFRNDLK